MRIALNKRQRRIDLYFRLPILYLGLKCAKLSINKAGQIYWSPGDFLVTKASVMEQIANKVIHLAGSICNHAGILVSGCVPNRRIMVLQ